MKRFFILILLSCTIALHSSALNTDSLTRVALTYAAHNNITALLPLFHKIENKLPDHVHLYCEMALFRNEGNYPEMINCIDSLRKFYPKHLQTMSQLSLAELKAEGLRMLGEYDELEEFCKKEISYFKKKGIRTRSLKELRSYQQKASRLIGNSQRTQLLQLVDRELYDELDSLYNICGNHVDHFTQERCRFALAHAFNRPSDLLNSSEVLLTQYLDSIDSEEMTRIVCQHAEELIGAGRWKDLKVWTDTVLSMERAQTAPIAYYNKLALAFQDKSPSAVHLPLEGASIRTSYEWPLLFSMKINEGDSTLFSMCTAQAYTLIDETIARANGAEILDDTLQVSTSFGILDVSPAYIESMRADNVLFQHLLVYVIHKNNDMVHPYPCALGVNELKRLKKIVFYPEKLQIPGEQELTTGHKRKGLYFSRNSGLRIYAYENEKKHSLSFDLSYPNNIVSNTKFTKMDKEDVAIQIGGSSFNINHPIFIKQKTKEFNAIVGVPFLRNYHCMTLDFENMEISAQEPNRYLPVRGRFSHETDKHYLARNFQSLVAGGMIDSEEHCFLKFLLNIGSNHPEKVIELCREMSNEDSDFYDAYSETEALFITGKYKEADDCMKEFLQNKNMSSEGEYGKKCLLLKSTVHLFRQQSAIAMQGIGDFEILNQEDEDTEVRVNNKKMAIQADLFLPYTEISEKMAKKAKVKVLGKTTHSLWGMIPEIACGQITLKNVPCKILTDTKVIKQKLPNKGKGLILGWNVLRHLNQVSFEGGKTILSTKVFDKDNPKTDELWKGGSAPLYHTGKWYVQTETDYGYPTYEITAGQRNSGIAQTLKIGSISCPASDIHSSRHPADENAQGTIGLGYLLSKSDKVTFDIASMRLTFETSQQPKNKPN